MIHAKNELKERKSAKCYQLSRQSPQNRKQRPRVRDVLSLSISEVSFLFNFHIKFDNFCFYCLVVIDQYAAEVIDCSSQFGLDTSISYTSHNILGRPSKYPNYGDFPETFAFRTYGNWWKTRDLLSSTEEFMEQNQPALRADDFIVLQFEECVFPEAVRIYEVINGF